MTIKRLEYGLLLSAAVVFHIFMVDYISFWIFAFFAMLPLVSLLTAILGGYGATAEIIIKSTSIQKNEVLPIELKIKNKYSFLVCRARVKLIIRNELMQEEQTRTIFITANRFGQTVRQHLSSEYCGTLSCRVAELRIYDALGLFSFRKKSEPDCFVAVLPSVYPLMPIDHPVICQHVQNDMSLRGLQGDDPSELLDIREYREGDRLTKILWKLSEKHDKLMVKELGNSVSNDMLLLIDLNAKSSKQLNGLLDTIYSVSVFLLENHISYKLEWYDSLHQRFAYSHITQRDDLRAALDAILFNGRLQQQPWVLKSVGNGNSRQPYSTVLYFCSEITADLIARLHKRLGGSRIRILLVADPQSAPEMNLTLIDLNDIKQSLHSLVL